MRPVRATELAVLVFGAGGLRNVFGTDVFGAHGRVDRLSLSVDSTEFDIVQRRNVDCDFTEELAQRDVECLTDGSEQFTGCFLLTTLDLRKVTETHPGGTRDVPQRPALVGTSVSEPVTDRLAQQDGHLTRLLSADS